MVMVIVNNVEYKSTSKKLKLYIVDEGSPPPLDRSWCKELNILLHQLMRERPVEEFSEVFVGALVPLKVNIQASLVLNGNCTPFFLKAGLLPFVLETLRMN